MSMSPKVWFEVRAHNWLQSESFLMYDKPAAILHILGSNYVLSATHDNNDIRDAPKCHPGIRTSFLSWLSSWVKDTKTSVYLTWLFGPAGAGKSAIARSLAESLHYEGFLAGSFFFLRTDLRRNTEKPFVMTITYQICYTVSDMLPYIAKAIGDNPTICSCSLLTQFETLVIEPLAHITVHEARPMLVVINGLNECINQKARNLILKLVFDALPRLRASIKFLIVSRPEYNSSGLLWELPSHNVLIMSPIYRTRLIPPGHKGILKHSITTSRDLFPQVCHRSCLHSVYFSMLLSICADI